VGIKFNETNLAAIPIGSNTHAACTPNKARIKTTPNMYSFIDLNLIFVRSGCIPPFFFIVPLASIIVPRGHIHPQKNLPKITVKKSITSENIIPGRIRRSLIEVSTIISGSILKNISGGKKHFRGYIVNQRIYMNRERKNPCEHLRMIISFFIKY